MTQKRQFMLLILSVLCMTGLTLMLLPADQLQAQQTEQTGCTLGNPYLEQDGLVVIEAEGVQLINNKPNLPSWEVVDGTTYENTVSGDILLAQPVETIEEYFAGVTTEGSSLNYDILFTNPGIYRVLIRGLAGRDSFFEHNDSIHAGLNGEPVTFQLLYGHSGFEAPTFSWEVGGPTEIVIPEAGIYRFNLWMREDGLLLDRIMLTLDPTLIEDGETALGPAASPCATTDPIERPENSCAPDYIFIQNGADPITLEAEHFAAQSGPVDGQNWLLTDQYAETAANGLAMIAAPNLGTNNRLEISNAPVMSYTVDFATAGDYFFFGRGRALDEGDILQNDSMHVGLNGIPATNARGIGLTSFQPDRFGWYTDSNDGIPTILTVTEPGRHTINVWMREDGLILDRLHLSLAEDFERGDPTLGPIGTGCFVSATPTPTATATATLTPTATATPTSTPLPTATFTPTPPQAGSVEIVLESDPADGTDFNLLTSFEIDPALKQGIAARSSIIGLNTPRGLFVLNDATLFVADSGNNAIKQLDQNGTLLQTIQDTPSDPAHPRLAQPYDVAVGPNGEIAVADFGNNRLVLFDPNGEERAIIGERGTGPGQFTSVKTVAIDAAGNLYAGDTNKGTIQKFDPAGQLTAEYMVMGNVPGRFEQPQDIVIDPAGRIIFVDSATNKILIYDNQFNFVQEWVTRSTNPRGIALDGDQNIYITGFSDPTIEKYDSAGTFQYLYNRPGADLGDLSRPKGVAVLSNNTLIVADQLNNRLQRFEPAITLDDADPADDDIFGQRIELANVPAAQHTIALDGPLGWQLSVGCTGVSDVVHSGNLITLTLNGGETVSCLFENQRP